MHLFPAASILALLAASVLPHSASGHGYVTSPRSRNFVAHEDGETPRKGKNAVGTAGVPPLESCPHCLNRKDVGGVCGYTSTNNYENDAYVDVNSVPMPWNTQANYTAGSTVAFTTVLAAHHRGHMELRACPFCSVAHQFPYCFDDVAPPTQECFDQYPLEFEADLSNAATTGVAQKDPFYPWRGMYSPNDGGPDPVYVFEYNLPDGLTSEKVLLQYIYVTANSCNPPGYDAYFLTNPDIASWYSPSLGECTMESDDGVWRQCKPEGICGERFWNCIEVKIVSPP